MLPKRVGAVGGWGPSPTGKLMEAIIESVDEFYSENLAQEVVQGMRESASRGYFLASRAPSVPAPSVPPIAQWALVGRPPSGRCGLPAPAVTGLRFFRRSLPAGPPVLSPVLVRAFVKSGKRLARAGLKGDL